MDLVLWSGPVSPFDVKGATVPGAKEKFFGCRGDVTVEHPHCPTLAGSWLDAEGRRLPKLLKSIGLSEDQVDNIYIGAFSAGGSAWRRLLMHPKDRSAITAVMLSDATYSSPQPVPLEGFVLYALDAMSDPSKLFVATASASPNKNFGSGEQVLAATRKEIEKRSGKTFKEGGDFPEQPESVFTAPSGNVIFANYGMKGGGHGFHPKIAPAIWQGVLQPWSEGRGFGGNDVLVALAYIAAGAAIGYGAVAIFEKVTK